MTSEPDNILVTCPYEPSHRIFKYRIQSHLVKCAKNHPNVKKVKCPFDVTHVLNPKDLEEHVEECPNRASLKMFLCKEENYSNSNTSTISNNNSALTHSFESTEDWDSYNCPTYNPNRIIDPNLVRGSSTISGLTPTEKDKIRMEDAIRRRLNIFSR
ncbi:GTSF1.2 family protein [Megaselia abdita]